ncbi:MAG: histone deacetylase family protein, partial [Gammaproteobacteria bacterium]|nr:histone deacetylase family protein [Gammaproteobacteria bacterium]
MSTIIIQHDDCLRHDPGARHPESSHRVKAVLGGLEGLTGLERLPAPYATSEQIKRVHPADFWDDIQAREPSEGSVAIDADTFLNHGSVDAALRASGGMCFAIDQVLESQALRAFCVVRPPGHHSEPERAMGFCLLNHVAIGALHALENAAIRRVAIVD